MSSSDLQFTPFREAVHLEQPSTAVIDDDGGSRWVVLGWLYMIWGSSSRCYGYRLLKRYPPVKCIEEFQREVGMT